MNKEENNYFEKFQDSHWVGKGSDPKSEQRVNEEFDAKFEKARKVTPASKKFKEFFENLKLLYEYLKSGDDIAAKALIIGALLYFISPIDLVPDFIPIAGYLDDIAVIAGVVALLASQLKKFKEKLDAHE
jgi:uncharacterized membrane protein YkvA (DUF1232 family)